jgi:outer membrane receptor protein involved in Fe transport
VNGQPDFVYATPEKLDNYEIGSKNTFWDGRALLNVAIYHEKVKDQQIVSTQDVLTSAGARLITAAFNVGESRVNGAEIEATVKPLEHWTFGLGLGWADQEFTNGNPVVLQASTSVLFPGVAGQPVIIKGKTQANVPTWNGSLTAAYRSLVGSGGLELDVRTDAIYRGKFYGDLANISVVPSSWKLNLRAGIGRADSWQASLYGKNLNNDKTATVTGLAGAAATCTFIETNTAQYGTSQQCLYAFMPRPREVGLEFTFKY